MSKTHIKHKRINNPHKTKNMSMSYLTKRIWEDKKTRAVVFAIFFGLVGSALYFIGRAATTDEILFPADANITNVKAAPYNAKGDGVTDDTAAILFAITSNDADNAVARSAPKTVYLPKGTYLISDSIIAETSTVRFIGAGQGFTTIKLKDNATGYNDASRPKYVLKSGNFQPANLANSGFSNYFQDFTLDVGSGNLGAIGIRHDVANTGAMQRVTVRAGVGSGKYGVSYETSAGPALVQDVTIEGFEYGVYLDRFNMNVITFEDLIVNNQRTGGILNDSKNIVLENFVSGNNSVAIRTISNFASVMIMGGNFTGKGSGAAIDMPIKGFLHVRDISSTAYSNIITLAGSSKFAGKSFIKEWSTENYKVGSVSKTWTEDNDYVSLRLPIKEAPTHTDYNFANWASVQSFGATAGTSMTDAANSNDDGPAIQQAIDSGAETIYFPYGYYTIRSDVTIRGNVKKIDFMFSRVDKSGQGRFLIENVNGTSVVIENVSTGVQFVHKSPDTVVIRNINSSGGGITTDVGAKGDLFSENNGAHANLTINQPISVWVRSMDRTNVDWTNNGGTLWVLSSNVESDTSHTISTNGAKTEIFGGTLDSLYTLHPSSLGAIFQSTNSYMSVFMPGSLRSSATEPASWEYLVHDAYPTGTTDIYDTEIVKFTATSGGDSKFVLPLYVTPGYSPVDPPPPPPIGNEYPIGTAVTTSNSAPDCPSNEATCQTISVTCPGVQLAETASVAEYPSTSGTTRGVLVSFIGLEGHGFSLVPNQSPLNGQLRSDGFKIIDISWTNGWAYSAPGEDAGSGRLACRSAAAIKWAYDNKYVPLSISVSKIGQCGFCGIGHSGGSAQVTYSLAYYHLENIMNAAIVYGGPSHASLTQGCTAASGSPGSYSNSARSLIDASFGYPFPAVNGPCYLKNINFISRWDQESVEIGGNDYTYPNTRVYLINGDQDNTMVPKGDAYILKLQSSGSPYVTKQILAGVGHDVNKDVGGQAAIRAAILADTGVLVGNPPPFINGDINGDSLVNVFDLSILAANWGKSGMTRAQGDLNSDGVVNVFDLSIMAINWGT